MTSKIKNIYCGKKQIIKDERGKEYLSSYKKQNLNQDRYLIVKDGFLDDTQSDRNHHGGEDKAVCVYSLKNYEYFRSKFDIDLPECAFGENLSLEDLDDSHICLGDRFQLGEVVFEVSQPRQPCWKISSITGIKNLTALVVKEAKSGFYFRVIKEGNITPSDELNLISRKYPKITIEHINKCAYDAKNNQENIKEILECEELAQAYRESLTKRYKDKESGIQDFQKDNY